MNYESFNNSFDFCISLMYINKISFIYIFMSSLYFPIIALQYLLFPILSMDHPKKMHGYYHELYAILTETLRYTFFS